MATEDPTPRAPAHRRAIARSLAAILLFAAVNVVATASPARADCAPLDLQCLAQEVLDPITETVGDVLDPVTETLEEVLDPVLDPVEEVLDPILDPVEEVIAPILGGTGDLPVEGGVADTPVGPGDVSGPASDVDSPMSRTAPTSNDPSEPREGAGNPGVLGVSTSPLPALGGVPASGPGQLDPVPAPSADVAGLVASGLRQSGSEVGFSGAADAAKRLAFPLLLVVLGFLFVVMENRLDRRDPKLAVAARVPEVVTFG